MYPVGLANPRISTAKYAHKSPQSPILCPWRKRGGRVALGSGSMT